MTKPVRLSNGRQWATQTLAKQHFKTMLRRYSTGAEVSDPQDQSDLTSLLEAYDSVVAPGDATKAGVGIARPLHNRPRERPDHSHSRAFQDAEGIGRFQRVLSDFRAFLRALWPFKTDYSPGTVAAAHFAASSSP